MYPSPTSPSSGQAAKEFVASVHNLYLPLKDNVLRSKWKAALRMCIAAKPTQNCVCSWQGNLMSLSNGTLMDSLVQAP